MNHLLNASPVAIGAFLVDKTKRNESDFFDVRTWSTFKHSVKMADKLTKCEVANAERSAATASTSLQTFDQRVNALEINLNEVP